MKLQQGENDAVRLAVKRILLASSVISLASGLYRFKKKQDVSGALGVSIGALSVIRAAIDLSHSSPLTAGEDNS